MALGKRQRKLIELARTIANFENFGDNPIGETWRMEGQGNQIYLDQIYLIKTTRNSEVPGYVDTRYTFTEFIRERTRLYRETYLNPLFAELLGEKDSDQKVN